VRCSRPLVYSSSPIDHRHGTAPLPGPQQHLQEFDDTTMLLPARQKAASLIARYEAVVGSKTLPISVIFVAGNPLSSA
jgi:hypothetical protein